MWKQPTLISHDQIPRLNCHSALPNNTLKCAARLFNNDGPIFVMIKGVWMDWRSELWSELQLLFSENKRREKICTYSVLTYGDKSLWIDA